MPTYISKQDIDATAHLSSRMAAKQLGVGKSTINDYRAMYGAQGTLLPSEGNILILDIESKPGTAYFWGPKIDWLPSQMVIEPPAMMCFSYKWLGKPEVYFVAEWDNGHEAMVRQARAVLNKADIVVTYNGDRYDLKKINNEFIKYGLPPASPFRSIDLFKTNRARFDLPYKKLDYLAQTLGTGEKVGHSGFDLWRGCMEGDPEARALMKEYNEGDVTLTERTYIKLLPWLTNVPHMGMFASDGTVCPYCQQNALRKTGDETRTFAQTYDLYLCDNCEGWSRGNKPVRDPLLTRVAR